MSTTKTVNIFDIQRQIQGLEARMHALENQLHEAKKKLDWDQYNWLGLDKKGVRENVRFFNNPMMEEVAKKENEYKRIMREIWSVKERIEALRKKERWILSYERKKRIESKMDKHLSEFLDAAMQQQMGPKKR